MTVRTEQMKQILDIRREDPEKEKELCMQLLSECEDKYVEAFGRTYLGDAYHTLGKIEHALPEYSRALEIAEENDYDDLLSVLYNSIGIVYMYNDDEQSALDYFFYGIRLAEKLSDKMMHATLLANIAYIYREAGAFDEAEEMLDESSRMICKAQHNDSNVELDELGYELDKIWIKLRKQETKEAWKLMQRDEIQKDTSQEKAINFAIYYEQRSDSQMCLKYVDTALDEVRQEINQFEQILYLFELIEIAIKAAFYAKAEEIADMAEELLKEIGTVGKWTKLMEYRIEIDKALGKASDLQKAYEKYYEYDQKYEEEKEEAAVKRVRRKIELLHELDRKRKIEQWHADLYDRRGKDPLTGLLNRWGMKSRMEELVEEKRKHVMLAAAIIDVDFFKEYNDTYGHVEGDRCLKTIAGILQKYSQQKDIIGRYGGDEFLVVFPDGTKETVEHFFDLVQEELADIRIKNKKSMVSDFVTITAGGVVTTLKQGTDFTVCLHEADRELYEKKKNSKNGYRIRNLCRDTGQ